MRTLLALLLLSLSGALNPLQAASQRTIPVSVQRVQLSFIPTTGRLLNAEGQRMRRSLIWSDSKSQAFHLDRKTILRLYTGPRYQKGKWKLPEAKVAEMGREEVEKLRHWAQLGAALPVVETGTTQEGVFYAVLEKPKRGASGTYLVKNGRFAEMKVKMERLVQSLVDNGWQLGTFNPTQVYMEGSRQQRALLIKAYAYDGPARAQAALGDYYKEGLELFNAFSEMVPTLKANGPPLSNGEKTSDRVQIARMILEAIRTGTTVRVVYAEKNQQKIFHALPLPASLRHNDFLKGYIRAILFPEKDSSRKPYTLRLDHIREAQFLRPEAPAAPLADEDVHAVAYKVAVDKGRKNYRATLRKAEDFLRRRGASPEQLQLFRERLESFQPRGGQAPKRRAFTDQEVLALAAGVIFHKGYPWSETEYNSFLSPAADKLAEEGASFEQMILFFKTCREAPVKQGRFNSWSGD